MPRQPRGFPSEFQAAADRLKRFRADSDEPEWTHSSFGCLGLQCISCAKTLGNCSSKGLDVAAAAHFGSYSLLLENNLQSVALLKYWCQHLVFCLCGFHVDLDVCGTFSASVPIFKKNSVDGTSFRIWIKRLAVCRRFLSLLQHKFGPGWQHCCSPFFHVWSK